ncbi:hypothetical protein [Streptomyces sp. NBC_01304]|uniref:hypothetical protein n=1 Tax=Streptomyces sp. NBC_01304 TaxID=2903818 RepID=UPI002E1129D1|nr:hypothetical protein OG430_44855 [Streptomyces sp. NBC_01304]
MAASKAQQAKTAKRRALAVDMRLAGKQFQTIADTLGYASPAAAHMDIKRALEANRKQVEQAAEELRSVEAMRLDQLQEAVWGTALKGEVKAVEVALKVIDRRVKLFGLDAPQHVALSGSNGEPIQIAAVPADPAERARMVAEAMARIGSAVGGKDPAALLDVDTDELRALEGKAAS